MRCLLTVSFLLFLAGCVLRPSQPAPTATPPPSLSGPPPLELLARRGTRKSRFLIVEGQVRNTSAASLDNVLAVVETYDAQGQFVNSGKSLLVYTPLAAGQASPFKVMIRNESGVQTFQVKFTTLRGEVIPHTEPSKPPEQPKRKKK